MKVYAVHAMRRTAREEVYIRFEISDCVTIHVVIGGARISRNWEAGFGDNASDLCLGHRLFMVLDKSLQANVNYVTFQFTVHL
jgi:hypothetical protein